MTPYPPTAPHPDPQAQGRKAMLVMVILVGFVLVTLEAALVRGDPQLGPWANAYFDAWMVAGACIPPLAFLWLVHRIGVPAWTWHLEWKARRQVAQAELAAASPTLPAAAIEAAAVETVRPASLRIPASPAECAQFEAALEAWLRSANWALTAESLTGFVWAGNEAAAFVPTITHGRFEPGSARYADRMYAALRDVAEDCGTAPEAILAALPAVDPVAKGEPIEEPEILTGPPLRRG